MALSPGVVCVALMSLGLASLANCDCQLDYLKGPKPTCLALDEADIVWAKLADHPSSPSDGRQVTFTLTARGRSESRNISKDWTPVCIPQTPDVNDTSVSISTNAPIDTFVLWSTCRMTASACSGQGAWQGGRDVMVLAASCSLLLALTVVVLALCIHRRNLLTAQAKGDTNITMSMFEESKHTDTQSKDAAADGIEHPNADINHKAFEGVAYDNGYVAKDDQGFEQEYATIDDPTYDTLNPTASEFAAYDHDYDYSTVGRSIYNNMQTKASLEDMVEL